MTLYYYKVKKLCRWHKFINKRGKLPRYNESRLRINGENEKLVHTKLTFSKYGKGKCYTVQNITTTNAKYSK